MAQIRLPSLTIWMAGLLATGLAGLAVPALAQQQPLYPGDDVQVNGGGARVLLYPGTNVAGVQRPLLQPGTPYPGTEKSPIHLIPPGQRHRTSPEAHLALTPPASAPPATAEKSPQAQLKQVATLPSARVSTTKPARQPAQTPSPEAVATSSVPFAFESASPDISLPGVELNSEPQSAPASAQPQMITAKSARETRVAPAQSSGMVGLEPVTTTPSAVTKRKEAREAKLETNPQQATAMQHAPAKPAALEHAGLSKRTVVTFASGATELAPASVGDLKKLASDLSAALDRGNGGIQLEAFGGAPGDKSSEARRISLKRALAVRAQLIEDGVPPERIDVRALGGVDDGGAPDRVDVFVRAS